MKTVVERPMTTPVEKVSSEIKAEWISFKSIEKKGKKFTNFNYRHFYSTEEIVNIRDVNINITYNMGYTNYHTIRKMCGYH